MKETLSRLNQTSRTVNWLRANRIGTKKIRRPRTISLVKNNPRKKYLSLMMRTLVHTEHVPSVKSILKKYDAPMLSARVYDDSTYLEYIISKVEIDYATFIASENAFRIIVDLPEVLQGA